MKFCITTAIDYPNNNPHIGTAFEKIGADVQARFRRMIGNDVLFLMGNDENTIRVPRCAAVQGLPTEQYCANIATRFKDVWAALNISNDDFIQTSEERHKIGVQKFIQAVHSAGYIYKKKYKGLYCEGCEEFKVPKSLLEGRCPNHPHAELKESEEENYFFKLSIFQPYINWLLNESSLEISPEFRRVELINIVGEGLEDISISRHNPGWGIPIPWDESQVVYVWFDALLNYLTGCGFGTDDEKFKKWWPADVHVIGKDITRFHCILWPAMISAYNEAAAIPENNLRRILLPHKVFGHGFICQRNVKISKSGIFIDPKEVIDKYGVDAYRYYFLSKCAFAADGDYDANHFLEVYNADLVNNLGNLLSRTFSLVKKQAGLDFLHLGVGSFQLKEIYAHVEEWKSHTSQFAYRQGLECIWKVLNAANKYIEDNKPWDASVEDYKKQIVLRDCVGCLRVVAIMLHPYMPAAAKKIYEAFTWPDIWEQVTGSWEKIQAILKDHHCDLSKVTVAHEKCEPLFPRKK